MNVVMANKKNVELKNQLLSLTDFIEKNTNTSTGSFGGSVRE